MTAPYLEIGPFTIQFGRDLTAAESPVATRLLQVVSDWTRDHAPADVSQDAAEQVVFEVVRDALTYGGYELLSQFQNTTAHRTEAGTFDAAMKAVDDYLTDRHKRLLGIPLRAAPRGYFKKCDYELFQIGYQRVGIVTEVPVLDVDGHPVYDESMAPETTDAVAWVDGCLLEIQTGLSPTLIEQVSNTTNTNEIGWCIMPSTDGHVATVDEDGAPLGLVSFITITSDKRLRDFATGRDYAMRGDAVFEVGKLPHVFALCERQQG